MGFMSCEKVELPSNFNEKVDGDKNGSVSSENNESGDSVYSGAFGYLCTIDVATGEIIDSVSDSIEGDDAYIGDGSVDNPYSVWAFYYGEMYDYLSSNVVNYVDDVWVCGYVVGYIKGRTLNNIVFDYGNVATNIVLGDNPEGGRCTVLIPVQLNSSSSYLEVKTNLNLADNPQMLGHKVKILGRACKYMGTFGMKYTKDYVLM